MVKHVESADEFDALKKASKPVSSLSSPRSARSFSLFSSRAKCFSISLFVIFPQPTFKKESQMKRPLSFKRAREGETCISCLLYTSDAADE